MCAVNRTRPPSSPTPRSSLPFPCSLSLTAAAALYYESFLSVSRFLPLLSPLHSRWLLRPPLVRSPSLHALHPCYLILIFGPADPRVSSESGCTPRCASLCGDDGCRTRPIGWRTAPDARDWMEPRWGCHWSTTQCARSKGKARSSGSSWWKGGWCRRASGRTEGRSGLAVNADGVVAAAPAVMLRGEVGAQAVAVVEAVVDGGRGGGGGQLWCESRSMFWTFLFPSPFFWVE